MKYESEGSISRKSGSGPTRASTSKDNDRLKLRDLKERKATFTKNLNYEWELTFDNDYI